LNRTHKDSYQDKWEENMEFKPQDHTFAICAYKESPYLRECIESLKKQTVATKEW